MDNIMHNIRRQKEVSRVRMNRIINGYIEIKHPEIYQKAKAFYTRLDMLYPKKKDLRKTYEYSLFTTGSKDNKYKYNRASQEEFSDKMVLEIPLMSTIPAVADIPTDAPTIVADIPTDAPTIVPTVAADIPTVVPTVAADIPTDAPTIVADIPTDAPTIVPTVAADIPTVVPTVAADIPTVVPTVVADIPTDAPAIQTVIPDIGAKITLPVIPDEIIDDIITELRLDPEICNIFDDILNDETPLESELMALGF